MPKQQPDVQDNQAPPPVSGTMSYGALVARSKKVGYVAMQGMYAARRFLDTEISTPQPGRFMPTLVKPEDSHASNLRKIDKLRNMARKSHEVLVSASTVFPMTFFVDTVIVDRTKVTIINRPFFFTSKTISIRIEDILNVSCSLGPFFGSLVISSRVMNSTDHFEIDRFWRHDAVLLKHIIQGYMIALHNNVDTDQLNREELIEHLTELGHESDR